MSCKLQMLAKYGLLSPDVNLNFLVCIFNAMHRILHDLDHFGELLEEDRKRFELHASVLEGVLCDVSGLIFDGSGGGGGVQEDLTSNISQIGQVEKHHFYVHRVISPLVRTGELLNQTFMQGFFLIISQRSSKSKDDLMPEEVETLFQLLHILTRKLSGINVSMATVSFVFLDLLLEGVRVCLSMLTKHHVNLTVEMLKGMMDCLELFDQQRKHIFYLIRHKVSKLRFLITKATDENQLDQYRLMLGAQIAIGVCSFTACIYNMDMGELKGIARNLSLSSMRLSGTMQSDHKYHAALSAEALFVAITGDRSADGMATLTSEHICILKNILSEQPSYYIAFEIAHVLGRVAMSPLVNEIGRTTAITLLSSLYHKGDPWSDLHRVARSPFDYWKKSTRKYIANLLQLLSSNEASSTRYIPDEVRKESIRQIRFGRSIEEKHGRGSYMCIMCTLDGEASDRSVSYNKHRVIAIRSYLRYINESNANLAETKSNILYTYSSQLSDEVESMAEHSNAFSSPTINDVGIVDMTSLLSKLERDSISLKFGTNISSSRCRRGPEYYLKKAKLAKSRGDTKAAVRLLRISTSTLGSGRTFHMLAAESTGEERARALKMAWTRFRHVNALKTMTLDAKTPTTFVMCVLMYWIQCQEPSFDAARFDSPFLSELASQCDPCAYLRCLPGHKEWVHFLTSIEQRESVDRASPEMHYTCCGIRNNASRRWNTAYSKEAKQMAWLFDHMLHTDMKTEHRAEWMWTQLHIYGHVLAYDTDWETLVVLLYPLIIQHMCKTLGMSSECVATVLKLSTIQIMIRKVADLEKSAMPIASKLLGV